MRTLFVLYLLFLSAQTVFASKTWERDPTTWTIADCQNVIELSPWRSECYQPLQGDDHYLIEAKWLSPVMLSAMARMEQLEAGEELDFFFKRYDELLEQEGIAGRKMISIIVYPNKGNGMVGQRLRSLLPGDPLYTNLDDGHIKLVRNRKKDEFLPAVEFTPLPGGLVEGFKVKFQNDGFFTPRTWRAELVLETAAGEFKFRFDPMKMRPTDVRFKKNKNQE
jgi:hypothetical protein